jgi:hypothetical protein
MKKLLPIVMLLIGTGAGVGAGIFLRPTEVETVDAAEERSPSQETPAVEPEIGKEPALSAEGMEYVKLSNQFVVPIVAKERVSSLMVITLSLEVTAGTGQSVYDAEPKLRDVFLRALFDHAAIRGFDGDFTRTSNLDIIRRNLRGLAQGVLGDSVVKDVLIFEIARQDY